MVIEIITLLVLTILVIGLFKKDFTVNINIKQPEEKVSPQVEVPEPKPYADVEVEKNEKPPTMDDVVSTINELYGVIDDE